MSDRGRAFGVRPDLGPRLRRTLLEQHRALEQKNRRSLALPHQIDALVEIETQPSGKQWES